ncbi:TIGR02588 family protein [Myxosarcina sp. GI1]|uniref:TIGR02588 family protein n=1 Tax=Myxosarcina sp. GI1 TaxID=1541065 RepID=UPI0005605C58|nr:TIGR02588 family protein [Myxosarcina sp. GI1]
MKNIVSRRSTAEKISFSICLFILSVIFALLIYSWISGENGPPILEVTVGKQIRQANQQYYVPFEVINQGGETAESIEVIAELIDPTNNTETGTQQIDYLSSKEVEQGAFIFRGNPQQGRLNVRVASYKLP